MFAERKTPERGACGGRGWDVGIMTIALVYGRGIELPLHCRSDARPRLEGTG
jgi:hypothetical protein